MESSSPGVVFLGQDYTRELRSDRARMYRGKKRVLIVGSTDLITPNAGKQFVWRGFLDYLKSKMAEIEVLYIDTSVTDNNSSVIGDAAPVVTLAERSRSMAALQALGGVLFGNPLQLGLWYSRSHAKSIQKAAAEFDPDVVVFDTIRAGLYLRSIKEQLPDTRITLFLDDLTSLRYSQLAKTAGRGAASPLDRVSNSVSPVIYALSHLPALQRIAYAYEAATLSRWERRLIEEAGVTTLMAEQEVDLSKQLVPGADVRVMPVRAKSRANGCVRASSPGRKAERSPIPEYIVVGDWGTAHNRDALMHLCEMVPALKEASIPFAIKMLGRGAPQEALNSLSSLGEARFSYHGYVPDLRELYTKAWYSLVPVRVATGVRVKVIEAWSWGLPVLTTDAGVRGMPFADGVNGAMFADAESLIEAMGRLADGEVQKRLACGATETFSNNYDTAATDSKYAGILGL
ncbi:Glycosyltransferase [Acidisarcina polymorpha]|uniref:Glycosyltransferase n=1 Tax=Acidisarcina polymorpha TaxID=2211140 RepID=A0A2Z5FRZ3_9BACT|nr:Glycosyltransferase [Acidisarcina polymorpha]